MAVDKSCQVETTERTQAVLSEKVLAAREKVSAEPGKADLWMELGLAYAGQGLMREAVEAYSKAISLDPFQGIYYRHRAHRYLSCWRFQDACADFTLASRLIPDNWDVWYHLGLSHYLLGEYEEAAKAYDVCYKMSRSEDKLIAVSDWYWMTLQRLGRKEEAAAILERITDGMDYKDNLSYYLRLRFYKGEVEESELLNGDVLSIVTQGYGLSNYYRINGNPQKADEILDRVLSTGDEYMWYAFGYLAAMVDKKRFSNEIRA